MESSKIVLSIRIPLGSITVREVPFAGTVQELRTLAAKETAKEPEYLNLIYRGLILRDENDLSHYGLQCGGMVHVLSRNPPKIKAESQTITDEEANHIAFALKSAAGGLRAALARMNRTESIENVMAAIPGLKDDPVAVSILKDPDLLMHMTDPEVVKKMSKNHPLLAEAANHLAAELAEQGKPEPANEDMETDDNPRQQRPITGNQLAAALASAISGVNRSRQTPQRLFTPEMLNSALLQAFQSVPPVAGSPATSTTPRPSAASTSATTPQPERWAQQLQQMRELGLNDDALNRQMLEVTNGDLQAAIDLVMTSEQS